MQGLVVYVRGCTPVKIFFRLRLQNLFPGVHSQTFARVETMVSMSVRCSKGGGYGFNVGVVARVEAMVSMSARCSKGGGYGFNVDALF